MAKVYVTQENPNLNYSDAERFGEVHFITTQEYSNSKSSLRNIQLRNNVKDTMKNFDPTRDFVLLSGDPIISSMSFHIAMVIAMTIQQRLKNRMPVGVKLLKWDGLDRKYYDIEIPSDFSFIGRREQR